MEQIERMAAELTEVLNLSEENASRTRRYIKRAVDKVLIYCNREDVPKQLEGTIVQIAEDMMKADGMIPSDKEVASINRGDTAISYFDSSSKQKTAVDFMKNYESTLNHFRKMNLPKGRET